MTGRELIARLMQSHVNLDAHVYVELEVVPHLEDDEPLKIQVLGVDVETAGSTKDGRAHILLETEPAHIEATFSLRT